jgi:hypothetical protein
VILWLADDDPLLPDHLGRIGALWDRGHVDLVQSDAVLVHPDDSLGWFCEDWSLAQGRARLELTNTNPMAAGGWDASVPRGRGLGPVAPGRGRRGQDGAQRRFARAALPSDRPRARVDLIERLSDAESMIAALQSELVARREELAARGEELAPLVAVYRGLRAVRSRL